MTEMEIRQQRTLTRPAKAAMKQRVPFGFLVVTVVLAVILVACVRRSLSLESRLAAAGLGSLPDSAVNVMLDTRGDLFGRRTTFIKFDTTLGGIHNFIRKSTVSGTPMSSPAVASSPKVRQLRLLAFGGPRWWQPPQSDPHYTQAVFLLSPHQPYGGGIIVDYATDSVCIVLSRPSMPSWLKRICRGLSRLRQ